MQPTQDGSSYGHFGAARRHGPVGRQPQGRGGDRHPLDRHRLSPQPAYRRPDLGRGRAADPGRRAVDPRRRAAPAHPRARQAGDDAADADAAQHRHAASRATSSPRCRAAIPAPASSLIGGHLDSWDLGTGAIDDAAGRRDHRRGGASGSWRPGRPRRTIRVVWFGAEEVGGVRRQRLSRPRIAATSNIVLVAESDFGADRVWRVDFSFAAGQCGARPTAIAAAARAARHRARARAAPTPAPTSATGSTPASRRSTSAGRHPLFRLSPHARRHARQGRSRAAAPECRGLDGDARRGRRRARRRSWRQAARHAGPLSPRRLNDLTFTPAQSTSR